jgi:hypothetical protein
MSAWCSRGASPNAAALACQHAVEQVHPLDIDAGLHAGDHNPACAAAYVEHRAAGRACQIDIEIEPKGKLSGNQVVRVTVVKR